MRVGTHAIALSKDQVTHVRDHLDKALAKGIATVFLISSDDPDIQSFFDAMEANLPSPVEEPILDSLFTGTVYVLGVDYEITPKVLDELGLEVLHEASNGHHSNSDATDGPLPDGS